MLTRINFRIWCVDYLVNERNLGESVCKYCYWHIFFLASAWSLLWIISSASLASDVCANQFNLFHDKFRCRQPYIALILFVLFGVSSIILFIFGWKVKRGSRMPDT